MAPPMRWRPPCPVLLETEEGMAMTEDLILIGGVFLALGIFGWSVAQAISGAGVQMPADDFCRFGSECVARALGQ